MAEVFPQTSFWLFFNVPLSSSYENTFFFNNATEQQSYFLNTFSNIVFSAQSYQRKSRGRIRVKANYGQVYNANYMAFVNMNPVHTVGTVPSYEQKRYYCFVTDVEYVNDAVSDIYYTVDVLQSFMFDWSFEQTFVERESTIDDELWRYMLDEGIPVGDYVNYGTRELRFRESSSSTSTLHSMEPVIAATVNVDYKDSTEENVNITTWAHNVLNGCQLIRRSTGSGTGSAVEWLKNLPGEKQSAVVGIYLFPSAILNHAANYSSPSTSADVNVNVVNLAGYVPKNKKLLCAPYNMLLIQSSDGSQLVLDPQKLAEFDGEHTVLFHLYYAYTAPLQGYLATTYNDKDLSQAPSQVEASLPLPVVPTCTWSNDTYKAWAALNSGYMQIENAASIVDAGLKTVGAFASTALLSSGGFANAPVPSTDLALRTAPVGSSVPQTYDIGSRWPSQAMIDSSASQGVLGDLKNIARNLEADHQAQIAPDSYNGSAQNLARAASQKYGFYAAQRCVRYDYAQSIDNYFTMFGYKVNSIKVPSLHNRNRFTYVKTANMDIKGRIPTVYKNQICAIFNSGIRWWIDRNNIGNYSTTNVPLQ